MGLGEKWRTGSQGHEPGLPGLQLAGGEDWLKARLLTLHMSTLTPSYPCQACVCRTRRPIPTVASAGEASPPPGRESALVTQSWLVRFLCLSFGMGLIRPGHNFLMRQLPPPSNWESSGGGDKAPNFIPRGHPAAGPAQGTCLGLALRAPALICGGAEADVGCGELPQPPHLVPWLLWGQTEGSESIPGTELMLEL